MYLKYFFLVLFIFFLFSCNQKNDQRADLIVINGDIWTANTNKPKASAFAVIDEKIVKVGSNEDILKWKADKTEIIDAQGKFITPGIIDSHIHFITGGLNLASVQLRDAKTPKQFINRISEFAKSINKERWITGGEWDHESWGGKLPTKAWIDSVTPETPVFITRLDGHMGLANSTALKMAGIDKDTKQVGGGEIVVDANGEPTGILKDNAMSFILGIIPPQSTEELNEVLNASMNYVTKNGVTSVHHVGGTEPEAYLKLFKEARKNKTLKTRIYAMLPLSQWKILAEKIQIDGKGDEWFKIGGLKGFVDGSLGSHTAAFEAPYTDKTSDSGIFVTNKDSLKSWVKNADKAGLQIAVHAIGDAAINFILNTYEETQKENNKTDQRFRVEHAQHIALRDLKRFAELNVIPSMQPYHAIDDGRWAENIIGAERAKTTYAFKSLFDHNAKVAFGSDWFVAPPTPIEGIYAAVTRSTLDGKNPNGWIPEQKISVEQALKAYTINAAYASFDENIKGSIEEGKLADFVIYDKSMFNVSPNAIKDINVLNTYVGGKLVYDANNQ